MQAHTAIMDVLLQAGADVNASDDVSDTFLHVA